MSDQLGSTRLLTNGSAQVQGSFAYDAYGQPKTSSGTATSPLGYAGQLTDSESGFQFLRAREYDPQTGQFLERDSYGGSAGTPTSLNRYTYGGDNPAAHTDPSGHCFLLGCVGEWLSNVGQAVSVVFGYIYNATQMVTQLISNPDVNAAIGYMREWPSGHNWLTDMIGAYGGIAAGQALTPEQQEAMKLAPAVYTAIGAYGAAGQMAMPVLLGLVVGLMAPAVFMGLGLIGLAGVPLALIGGALVGAISSAMSQIAGNALGGNPWDAGLGRAVLEGAAAGALIGLALDVIVGLVSTAVAETFDAVNGARAAEGAGAGASEGEGAGAGEGKGGCGAGGLSFSADTQVATPSGEHAIASLQVGDTVLAYNPQTGKQEPKQVQHVWLNHDHDLVDVQLTSAVPTNGAGTAAAPTQAKAQTASASTPAKAAGHSDKTTSKTSSPRSLGQRVRHALAAVVAILATLLGWQTVHAPAAPHVAHTTPTVQAISAATGETVHTTANHPWLTTDRGWVKAGDLHAGELVRTLDGQTAIVAWVHTVPGQADYYNLTVADDHTYAVGDGQYVVHNCGGGSGEQTLPNPKGRTWVRLYRAVTEDELGDIQQSGVYRNAGPRLNKFFDPRDTAIKFGQGLEASGNGRVWLTSGQFPTDLLGQAVIKPIYEGTEVMIPNELLGNFQPGSILVHGWIGGGIFR